jgi:hypothetical protein
MATAKKAAQDMVKALTTVFKKHPLTTRKRAWHGLMTDKGHKTLEDLLLHPNKPLNRIKTFSFREWMKD